MPFIDYLFEYFDVIHSFIQVYSSFLDLEEKVLIKREIEFILIIFCSAAVACSSTLGLNALIVSKVHQIISDMYISISRFLLLVIANNKVNIIGQSLIFIIEAYFLLWQLLVHDLTSFICHQWEKWLSNVLNQVLSSLMFSMNSL